jgi:thiaminase/transcriptional activator TenA
MRPTDHLRALCDDDWRRATDHVFCRELADGTLPADKMRWYLVQDYKFLDGFVRLLATAVAHAPTLADGVPAAQFLAIITGPENTYFLRAFDALGVTDAQRNAPAAPITRELQKVMEDARQSGRYEEMLAVLCVAEWTYMEWGERHAPPRAGLPFYFAEWIDLHSGPGFRGVVDYLRTQLDQAWQGLSDDARSNVEAVFKNVTRIERDFFDAAYASH